MDFSQSNSKNNSKKSQPENRGLGFVQLGEVTTKNVVMMNDPIDYTRRIDRNRDLLNSYKSSCITQVKNMQLTTSQVSII